MKRSYILLLLILTGMVANAQNWSKISAYYYSSAGIKDDGTLWGWGSNGNDMCLAGEYGIKKLPFRIGTATNWKEFSIGSNHVLALKTDGTLWAWGSNGWGVIGDGTTTDRPTPTQVGAGSIWTKIFAGHTYNLALKNDGTLWAWGSNNQGELGIGSTASQINSPTQVGTSNSWQTFVGNYNHVLAIKADGTLWAWGENSFGQLGDGTNISKRTPVQIGPGISWASLSESAGVQFSLAIATNGTLWGWGYNAYGQLGNNTTYGGVTSDPTQIGTETNWQKVSTGSDHTLAIKTDGTLWAWGGNYRGQLGDGTTLQITVPTQVGTATNWKAIATGQGHSLALKSDSTCWAWGFNGFGELGDGTQVDSFIPVQIFALTKINAQQTVVTAGGTSTGPGGLSSYSIGQVVYTASTGSGGSENQGIQQSFTILTVGIDNFPEIKLQMAVYPNPTTSFVNLKIDASTELNIESLSYQLSDLNGKRIYNQKITDSETAINLENLPAAIYFLTVINKNKAIKTFKIIKNN